MFLINLNLSFETCTCSSNLQWMFYFKNQWASGTLRCSWLTYLLDHWYKRVLNRFLGIRDFPYLRLRIRDYKAKSGQDSGLKVCPWVARVVGCQKQKWDYGIARNFGSWLRDWRIIGVFEINSCSSLSLHFVLGLRLIKVLKSPF